MTIPAVCRVNVSAPFPVQVRGANGIGITKSNGVFTVADDFTTLAALSSISDPATQSKVYVPSTKTYNTATANQIVNAGLAGTITSGLTITPATAVTALSLNPTPNSNTKGILVTQSGPTSGSVAGPVNLNLINVTGYNATISAPGSKFGDLGMWTSAIVASRTNFTVGGSNITINAEPFVSILGHTRITTATNAGQMDFEGVTGVTFTNVNINSGTMEGVVGAAVVGNGGTANIMAGLWAEADILTGGAASQRFALTIDSEGDLSATGTVGGVTMDGAIGVGVGSVGAQFAHYNIFNVISGTVQPIKSTGSLFIANGNMTLANVFNSSNWTVTGNIMNFPNFLVTGAGAGTFGPNFANPTGAKLVVSKNTVATPNIYAGAASAYFTGADGGGTNRVVILAPNAIPILNFVTSRGTLASPTATGLNDFIGAFGASGYGATGYGAGGAAIIFQAAQNWTDAAQGTLILVQTTPNGTATQANALWIQQSGGISIGTATDGGIGSVVANKSITAQNATAIPAGGTQDVGFLFSATAHFGFIFGSGAPTASMAQGSLYLRSDGGVGTRAYVNTNGSTTYQAIATTHDPGMLAFRITGVNFNSANTDNAITITLPPGITRWRINAINITNASASISTATAGVFTGAGGTGQTIAATQALTVTATAADANNNTMAMTVTNGTTEAYNDTTIQFRVGNAQGSAATADVVIVIFPLT